MKRCQDYFLDRKGSKNAFRHLFWPYQATPQVVLGRVIPAFVPVAVPVAEERMVPFPALAVCQGLGGLDVPRREGSEDTHG